ncbi:MAG: hypothetical protein PHH98_00945 [Candidatus Gracilibacteria bacterium]|nr:hypothetical protein [Candidatus Gracilibacteria bacterium]
MINNVGSNSPEFKQYTIQESIKQLQDKFFHDLNFEMDFSQGGLFLKTGGGLVERYTREELLLGLFNQEFFIHTLISGLDLDISFLDNQHEIIFQHLAIYKLLEEFLNLEGENESISKALIEQKDIIENLIKFIGNTAEANVMKEIIGKGSKPSIDGTNDVNNAVNEVLKK